VSSVYLPCQILYRVFLEDSSPPETCSLIKFDNDYLKMWHVKALYMALNDVI